MGRLPTEEQKGGEISHKRAFVDTLGTLDVSDVDSSPSKKSLSEVALFGSTESLVP